MKDFAEIRFPTDISYGASGGPEFSTDIVTGANGIEHRNINWSVPRARYVLSHAIKSKDQIDLLNVFFRKVQGKAIGFRFKDHTDYRANNQLISIADGQETFFKLVKSYEDKLRIITKPVKDSVSIKINNKIVNPEINYESGVITFKEAPEEGSVITADFEFDVPVRFDTDIFTSTADDYNSYSWLNINLIEIKL